jgi:hypothetical protein
VHAVCVWCSRGVLVIESDRYHITLLTVLAPSPPSTHTHIAAAPLLPRSGSWWTATRPCPHPCVFFGSQAQAAFGKVIAQGLVSPQIPDLCPKKKVCTKQMKKCPCVVPPPPSPLSPLSRHPIPTPTLGLRLNFAAFGCGKQGGEVVVRCSFVVEPGQTSTLAGVRLQPCTMQRAQPNHVRAVVWG